MNKQYLASAKSVSGEVIESLYNRASSIIEEARDRAYRQVKLYSCENGIVQSLIAQSSLILEWTHYLVLIHRPGVL